MKINMLNKSYIKFPIYALAIINIYKFIENRDFNCLLSFVGSLMAFHYFVIKNIPFAIIISLLISLLLLNCGKFTEGNTQELGTQADMKLYGNTGDEGP